MTRFRATAAALATLLLAACSGGPGTEAATTPSPVVLITVDTLRADRLGSYGARNIETPAMDALAGDGVRFDYALAQVPITLPSHVVILSGTYPMHHGVRDFTGTGVPENVGLLAEAFARQGYRTAAFVSAFVLDRSWGFARGFETYDDSFDPRQFETENPGNIQRRGDATMDRALAWLEKRAEGADATRPFFLWVHLFDPHSDYNPPEPFKSRYAGRPYDGEVAYTDSQLARLFEALRVRGLYDRALIVLTSDHGESLGEHGEDEHGFFLYHSTLHVPLIIKPPRGRAAPHTVAQPVATVDIAPTILDLAGLRDPLSRQFQGASLASLVLGRPAGAERPVYAETFYPHNSFGWAPLRSLTTRRYHYIEAPTPELYDLEKDFDQKANLYTQRRAEAQALREQLREIERRFAAKTMAEKPPLAPETLEKLKSLGYVAYSAPARAVDYASLPDPKDRLKVFKAILRATDLASAGRLEASNAALRSAAAEEPNLYLIPFMLAENASKARRWQEAEKHFLACLKLSPTFQQAMMGMARVQIAQGRSAEARPWLDLALRENPRNFLAHHGLGLAARMEKKNEEARRHFAKAVELKPNYAPSLQELGTVLVDLQRYSEALPALQRAAELGPENAVLSNYLGIAHANSGRLAEAVKFYRRALELNRDYAAARLNLAFALLQGGDRTAATREFQTLCRQSPALCQQYRSRFESL